MSSAFLIISISYKILKRKELVWEWFIYFIFNLFALLIIVLLFYDYTEAVGLKSLGDKFGNLSTISFAIQLFTVLALSVIQAIRPIKGKGEVVSGFVPIEETIKLNVGERELYKIHASKMFGYAGVLMLTSERILFSGKNIFINKSIAISIPFEKIVEVKKPRVSNLFLGPALKIWYMNENGKKTKITFNSELYNFTKNHTLEISSVFSFIYRLYADKKLQNRIKRGEQVTIVEQNLKNQAARTNRYVWIYALAFFVGIGIGGIIPMLVCLGVAKIIVWLLSRKSKT